MYKNAYSSINCNSPKLETAKCLSFKIVYHTMEDYKEKQQEEQMTASCTTLAS